MNRPSPQTVLPALALGLLALPTLASDFDANPVLKDLRFEEASPVRTLDIHVEYMDGADFDRPDVVAKDLAKLFTEVEAEFDALLPGLGNRDSIPVVVVNHPDTWLAARGARPTTEGADFLDTLGEHGAIVMYDFAWPGGSRKSREQGFRFAAGQALFAAAADKPAAELPTGLLLGIGQLLCEPDAGAPDSALAGRLHGELREGGFGDGYFVDLGVVAVTRGFDATLAAVRGATTEARAKDHWTRQRLARWGDQIAFTLGHALGDEAQAASCVEWLTQVGQGKIDVMALGQLDEAAWTALLQHLRIADPGLDPRTLQGSPAFGRAIEALTLPVVEASATSAKPADAIAEGVYLASVGDFAGAERALARAGTDERVQRFAAGVASVEALRRDYLSHLASSPEELKLRIDFDGRLLVAAITRVGNHTAYLGENTRDLTSVAIRDLPMSELVERMEKEDEPFGADEARAWAQAFGGGRWKSSLGKNASDTLTDDLASVEGEVQRGQVLSLISSARDGVHFNGEQRLQALRDLFEVGADSADFEAAKDELRGVATEILTARFEGTDMANLLSASKVEQDGDRIVIEYDFSDPAQLGDWAPLETYASEWVGMFTPLETKRNVFELDRKAKELVLEGKSMAQHVLAFKGPIEIGMTFEVPKQGKKSESRSVMQDHLYVSVCDDLDYQHVRARAFGELDVVDTDSGTNEFKQGEPLSYKMGKPYEFELVLEDGKATTQLDGKQRFEADAPGREQGRMVLMSYSDRELRIRGMRIEAGLADDQGPLRDMWLAGQLAGIGF